MQKGRKIHLDKGVKSQTTEHSNHSIGITSNSKNNETFPFPCTHMHARTHACTHTCMPTNACTHTHTMCTHMHSQFIKRFITEEGSIKTLIIQFSSVCTTDLLELTKFDTPSIPPTGTDNEANTVTPLTLTDMLIQ